MSASVLLWDVDGTLLTTARAGVHALERALRDVCGAEVDLTGLVTSGLTDAAVASLALAAGGCSADEQTVTEFLRAYERHLPRVLPLRDGHVMPGVREILEDLSGRPDVVSLLLTGNTRAGAAAKLAHYGLDGYFDGRGAFCAGPGEREQIARDALAAAEEHLGSPVEQARLFVIGDTPHDIRAGAAIGARTIAVATGSHGVAELEALGPWSALERLPAPPAFRALIGLASR